MLAFPVATFVSSEKPLHVRVINALIYCGWAVNDWWLVVQFLFVCYIFLQTSRKLKYISEKVFKILLGSIITIPIILSVVIIGYIITVLVDQITKVQQATNDTTIKPALIFFYSLTTTIFILCVLSSLGYVIWTTVQLIRHLKQSSENSGHYLKETSKKAIIRIVIIVSLVALIAVFLCLMELISFIGEVSNVSVYFQVVSLIGKAIATWIFIVGLCILFGPISEMKRMVKNAIKAVNFEHKTNRALENSKGIEMSPNTTNTSNHQQFGTFLTASNQDNFHNLSNSSISIDSEPNTPISTISLP
ncbi:predicted protein [Naegleria gruberi]|uniref:Predicted protein n=1 Tax=Naegleria gruberi TaxID=5762 RepID=D2VRY4_NAEGR|nr:uncharacterized protein NAEGRDRAFT_71747 [Naegleria gruberi]EFC40543.1 predicted protein [Naegleria gruberi]|eukprot:XP_002673287.1 predicted protein [Naegleria gruberi strain NEG-M]